MDLNSAVSMNCRQPLAVRSAHNTTCYWAQFSEVKLHWAPIADRAAKDTFVAAYHHQRSAVGRQLRVAHLGPRAVSDQWECRHAPTAVRQHTVADGIDCGEATSAEWMQPNDDSRLGHGAVFGLAGGVPSFHRTVAAGGEQHRPRTCHRQRLNGTDMSGELANGLSTHHVPQLDHGVFTGTGK